MSLPDQVSPKTIRKYVIACNEFLVKDQKYREATVLPSGDYFGG